MKETKTDSKDVLNYFQEIKCSFFNEEGSNLVNSCLVSSMEDSKHLFMVFNGTHESLMNLINTRRVSVYNLSLRDGEEYLCLCNHLVILTEMQKQLDELIQHLKSTSTTKI